MLRGFQLQSRGGVWSSLQSQFRRFSNPSVIGESSFVDNELKKINLIATETFHGTGEMLIVPYFSSGSTTAALKATLEKLPAQVAKSIADIVDEKSVKPGDKMATKIIHLYPNLHSFKSVALVGLGAQHDASELNSNLAHVLGKAIVKCVKESSPESVTLLSPIAMSKSSISHVLLGFHDAWYKDDRFKAQVGDPMSAPTSLSLQILGCDKNVCDNISEIQSSSEKIASGVNLAKDLVGAPSNVKTPLLISQVAKTIAANYNLEAKILGEDECKSLNMGGYLAVQQGSKFSPQFIHLIYRPEGVDRKDLMKVALIGKGLTFDSGGYNLKTGPGSMIELMKFDMGGCASVLGCAKSIAQLKPKNVEVHFISAVCENMISSHAVRPGDIVRTSNGKTIEILNTDAEGRLTLADALVYAEKLEVDAIIDLATLTGACIVGLGEKVAGLYSNQDSLSKELEKSAKRTNERVWHLPLEESYKESIKGGIADLKNIAGVKGGGSITAALFLSEFIVKTNWAHIDMAGPVWDTKTNEPTGFGVKMLVDYLLQKRKGAEE